MLAFDSIPEEDLPWLRARKQLHLLRLPNQVNYLFLILQKPNLLRQFFALALPYLKDEDFSALIAGREEIVFDWVEQQAFEFPLDWRAQRIQKFEPGVLVLKYFDVAVIQSNKKPSVGSIAMDFGDLAGQFQLINDHAAGSIDHIDPPVPGSRVDDIVELIQKEANHVFRVRLDHRGQLVVDIPGLVDQLEQLNAAVR